MFRLKISNSWLGVIIGSLMLVACLLFFVKDDNLPKYVSVDSMYYQALSLGYCEDPAKPVVDVLTELEIISLNWSTIVSLGAFSCYISSEYSDVIVFGFNILTLIMLLVVYIKILSEFRYTETQKIYFYILFCCQPFLIINLISLNKELLSYLLLALMLLFFIKRKYFYLFLVGVIAGTLKVQFLAISIILIMVLMNLKLRFIFIGLSLFLPLVYVMFDPMFLDAKQYFARYDYKIRTENIALWLSDLAHYPFSYLVVMPIRLIIHALSGFSIQRIISAESAYSIAYQINAIIISVGALALSWRLLFIREFRKNNIMYFMFSYSLIVCILPFFQMRYFFQLLPMIMILLLMSPSQLRWQRLNWGTNIL